MDCVLCLALTKIRTFENLRPQTLWIYGDFCSSFLQMGLRSLRRADRFYCRGQMIGARRQVDLSAATRRQRKKGKSVAIQGFEASSNNIRRPNRQNTFYKNRCKYRFSRAVLYGCLPPRYLHPSAPEYGRHSEWWSDGAQW